MLGEKREVFLMEKLFMKVKNMKKINLLSFIIVLLLILLVSCSPTISPEKECSIDKDCVAATCCHTTDALNKEHGPDCSGQLCTMECRPETIDCGQGEVKCIERSCTAVFQ